MNKRVLLGMSGGVDSSVAAVLLQKAGYEVTGLTMCFNIPDPAGKRPSCCGIKSIDDAKKVALKLGIKHYVLNFSRALEEKIINDFCSEYLKGRTPNPCVRCNQFLKFDILLKKAVSLGCDYMATGHYARIEKKDGRFFLKKAKDGHKDQSYFLYRLNQARLKRILFPLGDLYKSEVRNIARRYKLAVSDKPGSQEICFVPKDNYRDFINTRLKNKIKPGYIVDKQANILGRHKGICFYTIGQRQGLGIAGPRPVYVTGIVSKNNLIIAGEKEEAYGRRFIVKRVNWMNGALNKNVVLGVKIRYNHKEAPAKLQDVGRKMVKVFFRYPQFAITPGQSAVFYKNNSVVGGGIIEKVLS